MIETARTVDPEMTDLSVGMMNAIEIGDMIEHEDGPENGRLQE